VEAFFPPFAFLHKLWCKRSLFRNFAFFRLLNTPELRATIDSVRDVQKHLTPQFRPGLLFHSPALCIVAAADFKTNSGLRLLRADTQTEINLPLRFCSSVQIFSALLFASPAA
jgi:hypothetical protein